MAILAFRGTIVAVTYEHRSAVIEWEKGRETYYSVLCGVPELPETQLKLSFWDGHWDNLSGTTAVNRQDGAHPAARSMRVDVLAITKYSYYALWLESQSAHWGRFDERWRGPNWKAISSE